MNVRGDYEHSCVDSCEKRGPNLDKFVVLFRIYSVLALLWRRRLSQQAQNIVTTLWESCTTTSDLGRQKVDFATSCQGCSNVA